MIPLPQIPGYEEHGPSKIEDRTSKGSYAVGYDDGVNSTIENIESLNVGMDREELVAAIANRISPYASVENIADAIISAQARILKIKEGK